ncbi:unnamed protein product [Ixodes pacificus]
MPEIEPRSPAWKPSALLTELRSYHAVTGGVEAGGVKKHAEKKETGRAIKKRADKQRAERGVDMAEKRACPLLVTSKYSAETLYPGGAEEKPAQRRKEAMV